MSLWTRTLVIDRATGAIASYGPAKYSDLDLIRFHGSRGNQTSSFNATISLRAYLKPGVQYVIKTWIGAEVGVYGGGSSTYPYLLNAEVNLAGPSYGATLDWVSVR